MVKHYYSGSNIATRDNNNRCVLEANKLRAASTKIYFNAVSAMSLGLGCFLSIFVEDDKNISSLLIAFFVVYATIVLSWLCWVGIEIYVSQKYPQNISVSYELLEKYDVETFATDEEVDDILKI